MAARKTKAAPPSPAEDRVFTVVLEDIRAQFQVFGEALHGMRESMDARFAQIDGRFEQVEGRFERIDRRFEQIDRRFEGLETDVGLLKLAVTENGRELKHVRTSVERLEERVDTIDAKLDRKVDRDEVEAIVERVVTRLRPH